MNEKINEKIDLLNLVHANFGLVHAACRLVATARKYPIGRYRDIAFEDLCEASDKLLALLPESDRHKLTGPVEKEEPK